MKHSILTTFMAWATIATANANLITMQVTKSSQLEADLNYSLTVVDRHNTWRSQGLDKVFTIKGASTEYAVSLKAPVTGKLAKVFGVTLTLREGKEAILSVPVEMKSKFHTKDGIALGFIIAKKHIDKASIALRCGRPNSETLYVIKLKDYLIRAPNIR